MQNRNPEHLNLGGYVVLRIVIWAIGAKLKKYMRLSLFYLMANEIIVKRMIPIFLLFVPQIVPSDMEDSIVHSDPEGSELSEGLLNYQQAQLEQQNHQDDSTEESKKAVSFMTSASNEQLQVEDQTPLIFSRSSSFESLNSFVQQPFQGSEYSSYQCSRVTSGRVSPSDLPDSPIQSRPYTPKVKI